MKTLVYFASGNYREKYEELPFDRIFLVDNIFKKRHLLHIGKVILIGLDCLQSIEFFKNNNICIDYFVSLNEGLGEGGGSYAINSDMFLGYAMQILKDEYYHMMYPGYYSFGWKTQLDLPYIKEQLSKDDINHFDPMIFSSNKYNKNAVIYKMKKIRTETTILKNSKVEVSLIHDSIWCDYNILDLLFISIIDQVQDYFFKFEDLPKVKRIEIFTPIKDILNYCNDNKLETVGITPWMRGKYQDFHNALLEWDKPYPKIFKLYHLNVNDYLFLKHND